MSKSYATEFSEQFHDDDFPSELLDRYTPLELLAQNDHSQTFLMREKNGELLVAAKKYHKQDCRTEDETLIRLTHPGLPRYIGKIEDPSHTYILYEFIEGQPLDKYAARPLSESEAVAIMCQLCDILAYLHGQNPPVIHRDIKPSNIIIDPDTGKVSLIDFGIARRYLKDASCDTVYMGTQRFSPPEQYGFSQTDNRADIYALGIVFCWLLTGDTKIGKDNAAVKSALLRRIVRRSTAFDPGRRYQNVRRLRSDLNRFRRKRTSWKAAAAVAAACVLFLAGFGAGRYSRLFVPSIDDWMERNRPVTIGDPVLEQRVRAAMNKPEGEITLADARNVTSLNLDSSDPGVPESEKIQDITALAEFANLRSLSLNWNSIADIEPIAGLQNLTALFLNGNAEITDFSPLKGLTEMKEIMLVSCNINDRNIECFAPMTKLQSLWIESPQLSDLTVIEGIQSLTQLNLKNCRVSDIKDIGKLPDLISVGLEDNPVADFTPLKGLVGLNTLYLSEGQKTQAQEQLRDVKFTIEYK